MKTAGELSHKELINIVDKIQQMMYMDTNKDRDYWNPDKEWNTPDLCQEIASIMKTHGLVPTRCPDCSVEDGEFHHENCDVERCMECGSQRITCECDSLTRMPWNGEWPFLDICRKHNLWSKRAKIGWQPCDRDDPEATEDLNRLYTEFMWDKIKKTFIPRKEKT